MTVPRPWRRANTRRVAFIDTYAYPRTMSDLRAHLSGQEARTVEDGLRQWFRLAARHPRAELTMPSVVVGDLWRGMARRVPEYDEFCAAAFGRPFPWPADRPGQLALTYKLAREEEVPCRSFSGWMPNWASRTAATISRTAGAVASVTASRVWCA